jgi:hypothetical protein
MREFRTSGSVEGAVGNHRPYSDYRVPSTGKSAEANCERHAWRVYSTVVHVPTLLDLTNREWYSLQDGP